MKQLSLSILSLIFGFFSAAPSHAAVQTSGSPGTKTISGNLPKYATTGKNMGAVDPATVIDITLWLHPHDKREMDRLAHEVTNRKSPNFRHFLSATEFAARFAPTADEAKTVADYLTAKELKLVRVGPHNFYVRVQGTVAKISSALHVEMNQYEVNGKVYRGNANEPSLEGPAASLVSAVYGLDSLQYTHPFITQSSLASKGAKTSGGGFTSAATAAKAPDSSFFATNCFTGTTSETFSGQGVTATYKGNTYSANGNKYGCGYTPAEIRAAYNLDALYSEGYDGTGQTIIIVDWCGSPTIRSDANAFSTKFGLPALTKKNFQIINYPTPSDCSAPDAEINLDVEWAHAIAPGADIALVVPPSSSYSDVDEGEFYAATSGLGGVISNSFGSPELYTPLTILATEDLINEIAAVNGVSANFSSGDDGDYTFDDPIDNPPTVSAPADSPYATGIGGVSLGLTAQNAISFQAGWGTNQNLEVSGGDPIDPPSTFAGFQFGSGGGPSQLFLKPSYQASLPGTARQVPDISWLADPYTGAVIAITSPEEYPSLVYEAIGGTSLACPMFSALWAIANQEAGGPLGQAAPYLYSMPASTITDIIPYKAGSNVTAKITDSTGTTKYSAADMAAPLEGTSTFLSTLWTPPLYQGLVFVVTFGTDSGLTVTPGWDNVTGLGVPNAKAFADYFKLY